MLDLLSIVYSQLTELLISIARCNIMDEIQIILFKYFLDFKRW
jgi:hypothetical protein